MVWALGVDSLLKCNDDFILLVISLFLLSVGLWILPPPSLLTASTHLSSSQTRSLHFHPSPSKLDALLASKLLRHHCGGYFRNTEG